MMEVNKQLRSLMMVVRIIAIPKRLLEPPRSSFPPRKMTYALSRGASNSAHSITVQPYTLTIFFVNCVILIPKNG